MNCYYYLNCCNGFWHGTRSISFGMLQRFSPDSVRHFNGTILRNGGWHFSFMGGLDAVIKKINAFAHQEYNSLHFCDSDRLEAAISTGADLFSRGGSRSKIVPVDRLPVAISREKSKYSKYFAKEIATAPTFRKKKFDTENLHFLISIYSNVKHLSGRVIDIGSGEGRSAAAISNAAFPNILHAVDNWNEHLGEPSPETSAIRPAHHDSHKKFLQNMFLLTRGNFQSHKMSSGQYFSSDRTTIKFCHLCDNLEYDSAIQDIELLLPLLAKGGILCGENFGPFEANNRNGGMRRAVTELLAGHQNHRSFWWWRKEDAAPPLPSRAKALINRFSNFVRPASIKQNLGVFFKKYFPRIHGQVQEQWWRIQARKRMRSRAKQQHAKDTAK